MERREFLLAGMALGLTACAPSGPGVATIVAQGTAGMNAGSGGDRPLTLQIVQMRSAGAFDGADFFALQNPQAALGGEFIKADQIVLTPGAALAALLRPLPRDRQSGGRPLPRRGRGRFPRSL